MRALGHVVTVLLISLAVLALVGAPSKRGA